MENVELAKKENGNAWKFMFFRATNPNILLPFLGYGTAILGLIWLSVYYETDEKLLRVGFALVSTLCVKKLTDQINKFQERSKFKHKANSAVRNLDGIDYILEDIASKDATNKVLVNRIEDIRYYIQSAISEWSDILPEIKDRVKQKIERLNIAIVLEQKKLETLPADKVEEKQAIKENIVILEKQKNDTERTLTFTDKVYSPGKFLSGTNLSDFKNYIDANKMLSELFQKTGNIEEDFKAATGNTTADRERNKKLKDQYGL